VIAETCIFREALGIKVGVLQDKFSLFVICNAFFGPLLGFCSETVLYSICTNAFCLLLVHLRCLSMMHDLSFVSRHTINECKFCVFFSFCFIAVSTKQVAPIEI
jgi:hypothetical protein